MSRHPGTVRRVSSILLSFIAVRFVAATINWQFLYGNDHHTDPRNGLPTGIRCVGPGDNGSWYRVWNRTMYLVAEFNQTHHRLLDSNDSLSVTSFPPGTKGSVSSSGSAGNLGTRIQFPEGTHGSFHCQIGSAGQTMHVKMTIYTSSGTGRNSIQLQCSPEHKNETHLILWFVNATFVAVSTIYNQSSYAVDYKNTSFTNEGNFTIEPPGNRGSVKGPNPMCLICIVTLNGSYGDRTVCNPGVRNIFSSEQQTFDSVITTYLRRTSEGDFQNGIGDEDPRKPRPGRVEDSEAGPGVEIILGAVLVVCAVVGFVLFLRLGGERKRTSRPPDPRMYRSFLNPTARST